MSYKAVLFDFDYTLADATAGIVDSVNYVLETMGMPPATVPAVRRTVGTSLEETFAALTQDADGERAARFHSLFVERSHQVMTASTRLFPDTAAVLSQLHAGGVKVGIVTSKHRYRIEEALEKFALGHLIHLVIGFEDVDAHKPSPEGLLKAIGQLRVSKAEALYVGDSLVDAHTARNAAVEFAAVTTGATTASELEGLPHVLIAHSLSEIPGLVELRPEALHHGR